MIHSSSFLHRARTDAQWKLGASSAAAQSSNESLAITRANYAQGRSNWLNATAGLKTLAGEYNPAAFGALGIQAGDQAFKEDTQIQEMRNQEQQAIGGAIEAGVSALAGGGGNLDFAGSSSFGEQVGNFFSGMGK